MAMAKCSNCGPAKGTKKSYDHSVQPLDYPNRAVICNATGCFEPALVWLDTDEWQAYSGGERYFSPITGAIKIGVE